MIWHIIFIVLVILVIWILIQKNIKEIYTPELFKIGKEKIDKTILTYNIQKFPWALKSVGDKEISNLIYSHSIILFQECFNEAYDSLETYFPDYHICRGVLKGLNLMNSGLVIMSKFPIINVKFYEYQNSNPFSFDYFSEKGFLVATIKIEDKNVKVINTHLQSSDFHRYDKYALSQINELLKYLDDIEDDDYIVGGDFNIDIHDFNEVMNNNNKKNRYKELIKNPSKPTIYINLTTSQTSNVYKRGYEPFIFDYFITPLQMSHPVVINSDYSDHNPVSSCFKF
jgi:endonuclease/exonuclease/phosphatase family metal-dependent hydrolase